MEVKCLKEHDNAEPEGSSSSHESDILTDLFRHESIARMYDSIQFQDTLGVIAGKLQLSRDLVFEVLICFLKELREELNHRKKNPTKWPHRLPAIARTVKRDLYRIHELAPVFNHVRAEGNLLKLHQLFQHHNYWPKISTQLSLTVFVTDHMKKRGERLLLQTNIIYLCGSSAYAFHMARKRLNLDQYLGGRDK